MADQEIQTSGVAMIRIDGARVRQLRESRGLTQLYLATAVEVTTDTISRWENRHYPTIKRENGLRLAEALDVDLEEILEKSAESVPADKKIPSQPSATRAGIPINTYNLLLNIGLALMLPVIGFLFWNNRSKPPAAALEANRSLPAACAPGLEFPVIVTARTGGELPLLVRETVPAGVTILQTIPDTASQTDNSLKWIRKEGGEQLLTGYLAWAHGEIGVQFTFSGSVAVRQGKKQEADTGGDQVLTLKPVHWADSNADYIISDDEVLEVYEKFGGLPGLGATLEYVEEIWMGSGYRWDAKGKTIKILP